MKLRSTHSSVMGKLVAVIILSCFFLFAGRPASAQTVSSVISTITTNPGTKFENADGSARVYLRAAYAGMVSEIVYHTWNAVPGNDRFVTVRVEGQQVPVIPALGYNTYEISEIRLTDGRIIRSSGDRSNVFPVYTTDARYLPAPGIDITVITSKMEGPNKQLFVDRYNSQPGSGVVTEAITPCDTGNWEIIAVPGDDGQGNWIFHVRNSCGDVYIFKCISPGVASPGVGAIYIYMSGSIDGCDIKLKPSSGATQDALLFNCTPLCKSVANPGTISGGATACGALATTNITSSAAPSGHSSGTLQYQWEVNKNNTGWTVVVDWPGGASTYNPGVTVPAGESWCYRRNARLANSDCNFSKSSNSVCFTAKTPATASISGPSSTCSGSPITLTASGGGTYLWSTGATTASITVSPTANTTYSVTVTAANGCTATASKAVTVNALPTAAISGPSTVCNGSSITLTASGGGTYLWSTGATTASITVSPTANTTYSVTVTGTNGCTATASKAVTVNALPTAAISGPSTVCNGSSITLTASGGGTYLWSTGATTASITVSPTANTTYSVTVTAANGCTATASKAVTVNALPTAAISGPSTVCNGSSITLTASGGGTYLWSTGATTASITVSPTANTTYSVTVIGTNGCTATASRAVTVNALPTAAISGPSTVCNGSSVTLTASGGGTYLWSTGATTASITVSPTANTTYSVTVTAANGCTATASKAVTVNALPTAAISGPSTVCNGSSVTLTASGGGTYLWSTGATTASITVSPTANTTYSVTVTAANGCTATASKAVTVNALPAAAISGPSTVCNGSSVTLTASGGGTYLWSTGATTASITVSPTANTTYSVTVTGTNGCTATASRAVTVNALPAAAISGPSTVCNGSSVTLTASGGGTYLWSTGETTASITVSPTANTTYSVTVTGTNGCTATASRAVTVTNCCPNPPTITVEPVDTKGCEDQSTQFTSTGTNQTGIQWQYLNNTTWANISGATTANHSFTASATGIYTNGRRFRVIYSSTNAACASDTSNEVVLTVYPKPYVITNTASICKGQSTQLTATGPSGSTFVWLDNNSTNPVRTVTPPVTTHYTVRVTTPAGCSDTAGVTVFVFENPVITATAKTDASCTGANDGTITVTATGSTTLEYSVNGTSWQSSNVFTGLAPGTYNVLVRNTNTICPSTTSSPIVIARQSGPAGGIAGSAQVCATETSIYTINPLDAGATYTWSANGSPTSTSVNGNTFTVAWGTTGTKTVTLTASKGGCTAVYTKTINVTPAVFAAGGADKVVCQGGSTTIGLPSDQAGPPGASFSWYPTTFLNNPNVAQPQANPPFTIDYVLTVTDPLNGCTKSDTVRVVVNVALNPVADAGNDKSFCPTSGSVALGGPGTTPNNDPQATINYVWTGVGGAPVSYLNSAFVANPLITLPAGTAAGTSFRYVLTVYKQFNASSPYQGQLCPATDTVTVTATNCEPPFVTVMPKVMLQGALFNVVTEVGYNSIMRDDLRVRNLLPSADPYRNGTYASKYTHVNNATAETVTLPSAVFADKGNNSIVDWVFVELHSGNNNAQVIATRSALLQRDGDVVDIDGVSPLKFTGVTPGNYYIAIRHRNHLGVMTGLPTVLSTSPVVVDFTLPSTQVFATSAIYQGAEQVDAGGIRAMWAGNSLVDGKVKFSGTDNDPDIVSSTVLNYPTNTTQSILFNFAFGYFDGDINMDGKAKMSGTLNDINYIRNNVLTYPVNVSALLTFNFMTEQIPVRVL